MKIFSPSSTCPSTAMLWGPVKRAWPQKTVSPRIPFTQFVTPFTEAWTTASLRALTAFMSTPMGPPIVTPKSPWRRATKAACALATNVLVGIQPSFTQVPPKCSRSIKATVMFACVRRAASAGPAWPLPMMIESKRCLTIGPLIDAGHRSSSPVIWRVHATTIAMGRGTHAHTIVSQIP